MQYLHQDKHEALRKEVYKLEAQRRVRRRRRTATLKKLAARPTPRY